LKKIQDLEKEIKIKEDKEKELKDLKKYLDNIVNSMPSLLISVDSDLKITRLNQKAELEAGSNQEQVLGFNVLEIYPNLKDVFEQIKVSIREKKIIKETKIPVKKGNSFKFEEITIYPLIANGVKGAVVRIDDITEKVRLEQMMIQSEKMLSIGGLAAGMAHEINNPLAGIIQTLQVLRNRLKGLSKRDKELLKEYNISHENLDKFLAERKIFHMVESIIQAGMRAAGIVNNMLTFARKSGMDKKLSNIHKLIDQTIELANNDYSLKKKYDFRAIKIIKRYEADLPKVVCHPGEIQQVLLNILKNGAEAMKEKYVHENEKVFEESKFEIRTELFDNYIAISIQDNGPGLDEETKKRIFEPFYTTKDIGHGTGLGLSVSYFIICENHKGNFFVESELGKGAKFTITLPIVSE